MDLKVWKFFLIISFIGLTAMGRSVSKTHSTMIDFVTSQDYDHKILSQNVLRPGSLNQGYDFQSKGEQCLIRLKFSPKHGVEAPEFIVQVSCQSNNGVCGDLIDCARDVTNGVKPKNFKWSALDLASKDYASNPFNDECKTEQNTKSQRGVLQVLDGQTVAEQFCMASYTCKNNPKGGSAACATIKEDGSNVCPQINECLTNRIYMPIGYTQSELNQMSSYDRSQALKPFKEPPKLQNAVSQASKPRNTGTTNAAPVFNPRTNTNHRTSSN